MTGWIIAGAVLLALCLLSRLPLGVGASRREREGVRVWLRVGPADIALYPRPPKKPKAAREKKPKPPKKKKEKAEPGKAPRPPLSGEQLLSLAGKLVSLALEAAGQVRRKLSIDVLEMDLIIGEPDPADAVLRYGQASAVLGTLWGPLTSAFRVKEGRVRVDVDLQRERWALWGRFQMTLTVGQLVWLGLRYGGAALQILRETRKESNDKQRKAA